MFLDKLMDDNVTADEMLKIMPDMERLLEKLLKREEITTQDLIGTEAAEKRNL